MPTPHLTGPETVTELTDWGPIPDMIEGVSQTRGVLLHKGPGGRSDCGIWECTPGYWSLELVDDEFCHFMSGRATYTRDDGEVIEIVPGTIAFFEKGWKGTCRVHETVRKTYMLRSHGDKAAE